MLGSAESQIHQLLSSGAPCLLSSVWTDLCAAVAAYLKGVGCHQIADRRYICISIHHFSTESRRAFWAGWTFREVLALPWPSCCLSSASAYLVAANLLQSAKNAVDFLLGSVLAACHRRFVLLAADTSSRTKRHPRLSVLATGADRHGGN